MTFEQLIETLETLNANLENSVNDYNQTQETKGTDFRIEPEMLQSLKDQFETLLVSCENAWTEQ